jgi:hypothetical protein
MAEILILATAGAGGDLHPLMAATLGLRARGHRITFIGDRTSADLAREQGLDTVVSTPEHDLGPRLGRAIRETQGLPAHTQGEHVQRRLAEWSSEAAAPAQYLLEKRQPDLLLTSLFGASIAHMASAPSSTPWGVVNSTFYVGPNPPRPVEVDFAARAVPLVRYFAGHLDHAAVVVHATDARFDYDHTDRCSGKNLLRSPTTWKCQEIPGS